MSVNGNEELQWRDLSPTQFSCNCNYSLIMHNKTPVHSTWGLLSVCAVCRAPLLNLSYELRPSWEQYSRYVPHRVSNSTRNAPTVAHISERWTADDLTRPKHVATIKYLSTDDVF